MILYLVLHNHIFVLQIVTTGCPLKNSSSIVFLGSRFENFCNKKTMFDACQKVSVLIKQAFVDLLCLDCNRTSFVLLMR